MVAYAFSLPIQRAVTQASRPFCVQQRVLCLLLSFPIAKGCAKPPRCKAFSPMENYRNREMAFEAQS